MKKKILFISQETETIEIMDYDKFVAESENNYLYTFLAIKISDSTEQDFAIKLAETINRFPEFKLIIE